MENMDRLQVQEIFDKILFDIRANFVSNSSPRTQDLSTKHKNEQINTDIAICKKHMKITMSKFDDYSKSMESERSTISDPPSEGLKVLNQFPDTNQSDVKKTSKALNIMMYFKDGETSDGCSIYLKGLNSLSDVIKDLNDYTYAYPPAMFVVLLIPGCAITSLDENIKAIYSISEVQKVTTLTR